MAVEQQYEDDVTGFLARTKGSDGRSNSSARSDSRGYYNSRDRAQSYGASFSHPASAAGQYSLYFKNTSSTKDFVVSTVGLNSDLGAQIKLWRVTGDAGDGVALTPTNENLSSSHAADAICIEDGAGTAISGLSNANLIDYVLVSVDGSREMLLDDRVRLSQNEAIAIEVDAVTSGTPLVFGRLDGYFE